MHQPDISLLLLLTAAAATAAVDAQEHVSWML
jgi:hypothetical protein